MALTAEPRHASPLWWAGIRLLRQRAAGALIGSNTLTSLGGGMQLLLHGWLAVAWGHSAWFLAIFAATRIVPKIVLTVPAGIVCDRVPRARLLFACRMLYAVASMLPLVGLLGPMPIVWLLLGSTLAGAVHAFDLSSGRAVLAEIIEPDEVHAAVALNRAGSHVAALAGPAVAFVLVSGAGSGAALSDSALLRAAAAVAVLPVPNRAPALCEKKMGAAAGGLFRYLRETPGVVVLVFAGIVPTFIDKAVALMLPSVASGHGTVSMALIAPEVGALIGAAVLALAPVRLGVPALVGAALMYAGFICIASLNSQQAGALVLALGLAGMASTAINTSAAARLMHAVPNEMRGRVFAV
jgi:MFS family permease